MSTFLTMSIGCPTRSCTNTATHTLVAPVSRIPICEPCGIEHLNADHEHLYDVYNGYNRVLSKSLAKQQVAHDTGLLFTFVSEVIDEQRNIRKARAAEKAFFDKRKGHLDLTQEELDNSFGEV